MSTAKDGLEPEGFEYTGQTNAHGYRMFTYMARDEGTNRKRKKPVSTGVKDYDEGARLAQTMWQDILDRAEARAQAQAMAAGLTVDQLAVKYLAYIETQDGAATADTARRNLVQFRRVNGALPTEALTNGVFERYTTTRLASGSRPTTQKGAKGAPRTISPNTVIRELNVTQRMISVGVAKNWIAAPPCTLPVAKPKSKDAKRFALPRSAADRLFDYCAKTLGPRGIGLGIMIGLDTGHRRGALLDLTWAQVEWDVRQRPDGSGIHKIDFAANGKGGRNKQRGRVTMSPRLEAQMRLAYAEAKAAYQDYLANLPKGVRPMAFGGQLVVNMTASGFNDAFLRLRDKLLREGIMADVPNWERMTPHKMKHTFITNMMNSGVHAGMLERIVATKAKTLLKHYGQFSDNDTDNIWS